MIILQARILRTFLRMLVEVGACVWAFSAQQHPALTAVALLAAYHVGALTYRVVEATYRGPLGVREHFTLLSLGVAGVGIWLGNPLLVGMGLAGFGFAIADSDLVTSGKTTRYPKLVKIGAKFLGMVAASLAALNLLAFAAIALAATSLLIWELQNERRVLAAETILDWRPSDMANVFHQSGYFAFCFTFWASVPGLAAPAIAILFPIGWLAYWVMELRLSSSGQPFRPLLFGIGHVAMAATLAAMAIGSASAWALIIGWLLTGLFGGTCYTMQQAPGGPPSRISDDLGAVLGTLPAALAVWLLGTATSTLVLGAVFAMCAAAAAFALARRNEHTTVTP